MKKVILDLNSRSHNLREHPAAPNCCRHHMKVLAGYGDRNFKFPDKQTLVNRALAKLEQKYSAQAANASNDQSEEPKGADETDLFGGPLGEGKQLTEARPSQASLVPQFRQPIRFERSGVPALGTHMIAPNKFQAQLPGPGDRTMDGTLFLVTSGLAIIMDDGKYDAIVAERFDPLAGAVNWALEHMEPRYQQAIGSLKAQLDQLQVLYKEALPRVLAVLEAQNPDVHPKRLEAAAVEVLDDELVQILTVLRIWTDAFAQRRDGMYRQLRAVTFVVEQAFKLQTQCEASGCLQTVVFRVGNVFVARFSNQGPATFPGTRGPIGAHAIEVPHDERQMIALMLVLYAHEFRHNIFADVNGLESEMTHAVISQIQEAFAQGQFKFSSDKIVFGRNKLSTIDLLCKFFADTIGEVDADLAGGVLQSGYAYLINMISTFSAMNAGVNGVMKTNPLLRANSYYQLSTNNGQTSLDFLPHPPDYIRAYIVAAALDEIGFKTEADECRRITDQAFGYPLPQYITWADVEGKSKTVIKISVEDLKQVAPVVAKAIIRTKLNALGGSCMFDIVNWTPARQAIVDQLVLSVMAGSSEITCDINKVEATYMGPTATLAYWKLVKLGVRPLVALRSVNENVLKMLDTVREHKEQLEAAEAAKAQAQSPDAGTPKQLVAPQESESEGDFEGDDDDADGEEEVGAPSEESDEDHTADGANSE